MNTAAKVLISLLLITCVSCAGTPCTATLVNFDNVVASPQTLTGDLATGTTFTGSCYTNRLSQFYVFTATQDGTITVDTCTGTTWDTALGAYKEDLCGNVGSTSVCISSGGDNCGSQSKMQFFVDAGYTYYVQLVRASGSTGAVTYNLKFAYTAPEGHKPCTAINVPFGNFASSLYTLSSTVAAGRPYAAKPLSTTLTYRSQFFYFDAAETGTVAVDTCTTTTWNSALVIYEESNCRNVILDYAYWNDNYCSSQSYVAFAVVQGNRYVVQVVLASGYGDAYSLKFQFYAPQGATPCSAIDVPFSNFASTPVGVTGNHLAGARGPSGCYSSVNYYSQYYKFTAAGSGTVFVDTCVGTTWNSELAFFRTSSCNEIGLPALCYNTFTSGCGSTNQASGYVEVESGETYYIQLLEGSGGYGASYTLTFSFYPAIANTPCDAVNVPFSNFISAPASLTGNLVNGLTYYTGCYNRGYRGQFYKFTATTNGTVSVDTCTGTNWNTELSTVLFTNCDGVGKEASCYNTDTSGCGTQQSKIFMEVTNDVTYYIQLIEGSGGLGSSYTITFTFYPAVAAEPCTAIDVPFSSFISTPVQKTGNLLGGLGYYTSCYTNRYRGQFYKFAATANGTVSVDTCTGTTWNTELSVVIATNCKSVGTTPSCEETDTSGCGTQQAKIYFQVISGETYYVQLIEGSGGIGSSYTLTFTYYPAVAATPCTAIDVPFSSFVSAPVQKTGNLVGGQQYYTSCYTTSYRGQFYKFTATGSGTVSVDTCTGTTWNTELSAIIATNCDNIGRTPSCLETDTSGCGTQQSKLYFQVISGETYYIQLIEGSGGIGSSYTLTFTYYAAVAATPCTAIDVPFSSFQSTPTTLTGNLVYGQEYYTSCYTTSYRGQFYKVTPTVNGTVTVDTCSGTTWNTELSVITSATCNAVGKTPSCEATDTSGCGTQQSKISFNVAGRNYLLYSTY